MREPKVRESEMGSDPRFVSGGLYQAVMPLFCWGSRQSEPQVREPKRNGCFQGCHWETLGPRPPEYGYKQEGPVQFQWVTNRNILNGDSFLGKPVTGCTPSNHPCPERKRGETFPDALSPSCLSDSTDLLQMSKGKVLQHFMQLQHLGVPRSWSAQACAAAMRYYGRRPNRR